MRSELLTMAEVADILRVSSKTVKRWCKQGTLEAEVFPHGKTRQTYRVKRETVEKMLGQTG